MPDTKGTFGEVYEYQTSTGLRLVVMYLAPSREYIDSPECVVLSDDLSDYKTGYIGNWEVDTTTWWKKVSDDD